MAKKKDEPRWPVDPVVRTAERCPAALHPDERELRLAAAKAQMEVAFAHFTRNPNADHWRRLATLMAEYQDLKCNVHSLESLDVKPDALLVRSRAASL